MLYQNTVTSEILRTLHRIKTDEIFENYILVGGTALALQLGHRISEDIDLFTLEKQDNDKCIKFMKDNFENIEILNNSENILQLKTKDIKVDFVSARGKLIEEPIYEDTIKIAGKKDIVGMKLITIMERKKAKDYIDIAYLLKEYELKEMFDIYKWKYNTDNIYNVKVALTDSAIINPYELYSVKMLKKDIEPHDIFKFINENVKKYNETEGIGKKSKKIFSFRKPTD
jgi:predicted nucleotidyltransferase component of viral defense system